MDVIHLYEYGSWKGFFLLALPDGNEISVNAGGVEVTAMEQNKMTVAENAASRTTAELSFQVMIESINEGALTLAMDGRVLYANRRFAAMVAMPLEKVIGGRLGDFVQTLNCPSIEDLLERATQAHQSEECTLLTESGKRLPVFLSLSPLNAGDLKGICVIVADLTEQKHKEKELAQLSARLLRLQDEERRRIARDLHDSTSQTLSALAINLAILEQRAVELNPALTKPFEDCHSLATQASAEVRNLSHLLHPPDLDAIGLAAALRWYTVRLSEHGGLKVNLQLQNDFGRLDSDLEIALFRVVQESLSNVQRHSGSTSATIRLSQHDGHAVVEIEDQGRGISPELLRMDQGESVVQQLGVGVAGMRERLRQLRGRLEIASGQHGTTVKATVPLERTDA
ncbi:MAG TPA: ATP-binding protein [Terriglobia bacterium]|nr:ATP-binding protein [Terriglobia bacterium]